jgi:hypothetical protein
MKAGTWIPKFRKFLVKEHISLQLPLPQTEAQSVETAQQQSRNSEFSQDLKSLLGNIRIF